MRSTMARRFCAAVFLSLAIVAATGPSMSLPARAPTFDSWINGLWPRARGHGVTREIFNRAVHNLTPDPTVLEAAERQPEFVTPMGDYLKAAVSDKRIAGGRKKLRQLGSVLARIEARFGVDRHVVTAIWGLESTYGAAKGTKNVIRSLATLGYRGERRNFGRKQLLAALRILQRGDVEPQGMLGSWAGAMGHTQFIPTTFIAHAVDFNGDGRRDIWTNVPDALASTANYLKASNWRTGAPWGFEVVLPAKFDYALTGLDTKRALAEWVALGVARADGKKFSAWARPTSVILPVGSHGPAFVVFGNFRAIMRYNNSIAYALAVGLLADSYRGRGKVRRGWPKYDRPLTRRQKRELQKLLTDAGYNTGGVDGRIGPQTRRALQRYQRAMGTPPDGYPSFVVLKRLRDNG